MADSAFIDRYKGLDPLEAAYLSMIESMDHSLRMIMDELNELDVADNTLIIFTSDDGALSAHSRGQTVLGTGFNTHKLPLFSGKGSVYEGGTRVPLLMSWGSSNNSQTIHQLLNIAQGSKLDTPMLSDDIFPTIIKLAGSTIPDDHIYDGISLKSLMNRQDDDSDQCSLFWHYPHKWGPVGPGIDPFTSIRQGDWKLIYFYDDQSWELYNIKDDITEIRNLIRRYQNVALELSEKMIKWMTNVDAQLPISKITDETVPLPLFDP
jgi:arylsulfatase A-like enzyme